MRERLLADSDVDNAEIDVGEGGVLGGTNRDRSCGYLLAVLCIREHRVIARVVGTRGIECPVELDSEAHVNELFMDVFANGPEPLKSPPKVIIVGAVPPTRGDATESRLRASKRDCPLSSAGRNERVELHRPPVPARSALSHDRPRAGRTHPFSRQIVGKTFSLLHLDIGQGCGTIAPAAGTTAGDTAHGTNDDTARGIDSFGLHRPRGFLDASDTDGSRQASSLCFPQRDKRARNPSFLLKNSQGFSEWPRFLSSAKSQERA